MRKAKLVSDDMRGVAPLHHNSDSVVNPQRLVLDMQHSYEVNHFLISALYQHHQTVLTEYQSVNGLQRCLGDSTSDSSTPLRCTVYHVTALLDSMASEAQQALHRTRSINQQTVRDTTLPRLLQRILNSKS